jgi:hypothetical protein
LGSDRVAGLGREQAGDLLVVFGQSAPKFTQQRTALTCRQRTPGWKSPACGGNSKVDLDRTSAPDLGDDFSAARVLYLKRGAGRVPCPVDEATGQAKGWQRDGQEVGHDEAP